MLDIFFTNKIPSSSYEWTDELILVASIFNEFDGQSYDYEAIKSRFETISRRLPDARDAAKYRDEYGAYASFLGVVNYERSGKSWIWRINRHAQNLLCGVLPDPDSFVRLQMALLQYPNPIGGVYYENGSLRIEPKAQSKRIAQIRSGVRTVPLRLFLRVLLSLHNDIDPSEAYLTYPEIWHCLFTNQEAVGTFDPDGLALARKIMQFRAKPTNHYRTNALRNLHVLQHTGLIEKPNNARLLRLIPQAGDKETKLGRVAHTVASMSTTFPVPDQNISESKVQEWVRQVLEDRSWGHYYEGRALPLDIVETLVESHVEIDNNLLNAIEFGPGAPLLTFEEERRIRGERMSKRPASREETEALREKANLAHRALVKLLADRLRAQDIQPESNIFVDLCCREPQKMLFEIKSCSPDNLLSQVRKGVSQLYEYQYRHTALNGAKLILALETNPAEQLDWLIDYLVHDRTIAVCWLEGEDNLACPSYCQDCLGGIVNRIEQMP
jgi:hypothetical protein